MKKIISIFTIAVLAGLTAFKLAPDARSWEVDMPHSKIGFTVSHFFTPVDGKFSTFQSKVKFSPDDLEGSSVSFTIPVSSIDTDNEKRDNHLMSEDFFNVEKWPEITFKSSSFKKTGDNEFEVTGDLTIREVTKTVTAPFKLLGVKDHPMKKGSQVAAVSGSWKIDRTDYKVGVGDWAATAVVGDEVDIKFAFELTSKK